MNRDTSFIRTLLLKDCLGPKKTTAPLGLFSELRTIMALYKIPRHSSRVENTCQPSLFKKHKGITQFEAPTGARGQRRALRNREAMVFPWDQAGPQAFRLPLRKSFWFRRGKLKSQPVLSQITSPSPRPFQAFPSKINAKSEARGKQQRIRGQKSKG